MRAGGAGMHATSTALERGGVRREARDGGGRTRAPCCFASDRDSAEAARSSPLHAVGRGRRSLDDRGHKSVWVSGVVGQAMRGRGASRTVLCIRNR